MLKSMENPSSIQFLRNSLLGNLFISSGEPGPVLKIHCKGRTGPKNLVSLLLKMLSLFLSLSCSKVTCMREILAEAWPSETLGLGGIFRIVSGKVEFCKILFTFFLQIFSWCPRHASQNVNLFNRPSSTLCPTSLLVQSTVMQRLTSGSRWFRCSTFCKSVFSLKSNQYQSFIFHFVFQFYEMEAPLNVLSVFVSRYSYKLFETK